MTHKFIVNTERVNEYGYRILTDGIDTEQYERNPVVLYYHERARDPKQVVGRVVKLYKENSQLIAEIEFDVADDFAAALAGKVERGFIRMCSLNADVIETSIDEKLILAGQTLETVTKCKLVEISIVDIGGNDNALKLSRNGEKVSLKKIETHKKNENTIMKTIALALGNDENASEGVLLQAVNKIKLAKEQAETRATNAETALKEFQGREADALIEKGVKLGLFAEGFKDTMKSAFAADHEAQVVKLSKLITDKEAEQENDETHQTVKEVILGKGGESKKTVTLTYDYLQKNDVEQLREIREKKPKEFARLVKDYEKGVRHKED